MSDAARGLAPLALVLALTGCPKELPRDASPEELYRIGRESFEREDWDRSIEALQRFLFQDPGHPKADSAQFLIGSAYFNQDQYLTAAAEFLRLAENRPAGPLADDARYRACESYYELSPRPELDQEYTQEAIEQCRSVVLLYPGSPLSQEASERTRELADKLAKKTYLTADYYLQRRAYDSAIVYFEHLLETYPGASFEAEAMLKLYETYRRIGYDEEARETRERLLRQHPDSPEARELQERITGEVG